MKQEIFEVIMAENVPKLMAYTKEHTREAERTPSRINTKKKNLLQGTTYSKYRKPKTKKQRKNLGRIQRTNIFSLQKPKYLLFL